ncbi:MAG: ferritin family protein [Thermodesulfobacteriota bacterium]|nr:ferritin family protein [Thermodesulfobacteriota bacterium]
MNAFECRSISDVVDFAVKREENARDYYLQCRDKAENSGIKDFFKELADEEEKHRKLLTEVDLSDAGTLEPAQVENLKLSDFMVNAEFSPDITYQEALTLAMKKEEKAHAFYAAWKDKCKGSKVAELFEFLAGEEMKHKRKLEDIYDEDILMWN